MNIQSHDMADTQGEASSSSSSFSRKRTFTDVVEEESSCVDMDTEDVVTGQQGLRPPHSSTHKSERNELPSTIYCNNKDMVENIWRQHPYELKNPTDKRVEKIEFTDESFFAIIESTQLDALSSIIAKGCKPYGSVILDFGIVKDGVRARLTAGEENDGTVTSFALENVFALVHMGRYRSLAITMSRSDLDSVMTFKGTPKPMISFYARDILATGHWLVTDTICSQGKDMDESEYSTVAMNITTQGIEKGVNRSVTIMDKVGALSTLRASSEVPLAIAIPIKRPQRITTGARTTENTKDCIVTVTPRNRTNGEIVVDLETSWDPSLASSSNIRCTTIPLPPGTRMETMYGLYRYPLKSMVDGLNALKGCSRDDAPINLYLQAVDPDVAANPMIEGDDLRVCPSSCLLANSTACGKAIIYIAPRIDVSGI